MFKPGGLITGMLSLTWLVLACFGLAIPVVLKLVVDEHRPEQLLLFMVRVEPDLQDAYFLFSTPQDRYMHIRRVHEGRCVV